MLGPDWTSAMVAISRFADSIFTPGYNAWKKGSGTSVAGAYEWGNGF